MHFSFHASRSRSAASAAFCAASRSALRASCTDCEISADLRLCSSSAFLEASARALAFMTRISAASNFDFSSLSVALAAATTFSDSASASRAAFKSAVNLPTPRSASFCAVSSSSHFTLSFSIASLSPREDASTLCSISAAASSCARCASKSCCSKAVTRRAMVKSSCSALSRAASTSSKDVPANVLVSSARLASASSERSSANSLIAVFLSATAPVRDFTSS